MGIHYENLDEITRGFMLQESDLGGHYPSPRLTQDGLNCWVEILNLAIATQNDDWLAAELIRRRCFLPRENYIRGGKTYSRNINAEHAAQQLAEGEFNRYYLRGLCLRAQKTNVSSLIVYRGKQVERPRPESEALIGKPIGVVELLDALRSHDFVTIEDAFRVPGGPNSGLTARLPTSSD